MYRRKLGLSPEEIKEGSGSLINGVKVVKSCFLKLHLGLPIEEYVKCIVPLEDSP